jgi:hypothetical protein
LEQTKQKPFCFRVFGVTKKGTREMKTISEHNNSYQQPKIELLMAGVLCDDCQVEMFYPQPYAVLACIPPKMTVQCPKCNKVDYKIR